MKNSVEIKNLDLSFGAVKVLQDLNLDIGEGEFLVLLGSSGCGKSTLLNCIAGLLEVTDGQIHIKGKNVTWAEPSERGIGMVFQSLALFPHMSVARNIGYGLKLRGVKGAAQRDRVEEYLSSNDAYVVEDYGKFCGVRDGAILLPDGEGDWE